MYLVPIFHDEGLLQVRFERAVGGSLGEGAGMPEGCGFSTVCAFSHWITSFLAIIPNDSAFLRRHGILPRDPIAGKMVNWI